LLQSHQKGGEAEMRTTKKFIFVAALVVLVLLGSLAGVAFAKSGSTDKAASGNPLLARVAAILGIDQQEVEDAFAQAQRELQDEVLDNQLKSLIEQGKITQDQADQYKAWLEAKPDMEPFQQQLREWQQARPDIPPEVWQEAGGPGIPGPGIPPPGGSGGPGLPGGPSR
jgi:hypothetical protein